MTRNSTHCACRVPLDETVTPIFGPTAGAFAWLADHGVTDIGPDHLGRHVHPGRRGTAALQRGRGTGRDRRGRPCRGQGGTRCRGGRAARGRRGCVHRADRRRRSRLAGGDDDGGRRKARRRSPTAWTPPGLYGLAAPFEVRVEVHQLNVPEGDTTMSYDLATVLPRATVEDGIARAVAKANR